jgi:hypothetical protein
VQGKFKRRRENEFEGESLPGAVFGEKFQEKPALGEKNST